MILHTGRGRRMELRDIVYFLAVCEHDSMSAAAETLFISQQALSKSIRKLERHLGVSLFDRSVHGVKPTNCALELLPYAKRVIEDCREMEGLAKTMGQHGLTHRIRLGFACGCFNSRNPVSADDIARFGTDHPDIDIVISECSPVEQVDSLLQGHLDLAYMIGKTSDPQLNAHLVCREKSFVVMSNRCPLASKDTLAPDDLAGYTMLVPSDFKSDRLSEDARAATGLEGVPMSTTFFNGAFPHIVEHVRMNEGIWCAGESYCQTVDPDGLAFVPLAGKTSDHYLVHRKGMEKNPAVACVLGAFAPSGRA